MNRFLPAKIKIIISILLNHKKKTVAGSIVLLLIFAWKRRNKIINYEYILGKMSDKLMKSLEENMQEREKVKAQLNSLEQIKNTFFTGVWPASKKDLRKELHALFNIHQLRDKLRSKVIDQEEKKMLWEDFKEQILCFASLTLVSNKMIMFSKILQDLLRSKYSEKLSSCGIADSLEIADYILKDFFEHLNSESLKNMQNFIRERLRPRISRLKPNEEFTLPKIIVILHTFQKELCGFVGHPISTGSNAQSLNNTSILKDFKNGQSALHESNLLMLDNKLLGEKKNFRSKLKNYFSGEHDKLKVPKAVLGVVQEFINCFSQHKIFNQRSFIEKCIDFNTEKRSNDINKESIIQINHSDKKQEEQEQNSHENKANKEFFAEALLTACCEAMDWFESSSLQTYLYYGIKFEFMKFQNRLSLYFSRNASSGDAAGKPNDRMTLAHYLTLIYKIVQEEFLEDNSEINSQAFYKQKLKIMMGLSTIEKIDENDLKDFNLNVKTIEEFERNLWLEESFSDLLKKVYLDSEILDKIGKPGPSNEEFDDVFKLLSKLS